MIYQKNEPLILRASDVRVREGQKRGTEVTKKSSFSASDTHVRGSKTHFLSPSQNGNAKEIPQNE